VAAILQPVILPGFVHFPGLHCGSTALVDALAARGLTLSEPMAFGLGAGLGFYALEAPGRSPSLLFQGRAAHLERTACEVLGAVAVERTADDPASAWAGVRRALERGIAPIVATDLAELPYFRTRTRFGGHRIVLAGYDDARGVAMVADNERPGLQEVPLDALDRARASIAPPFGLPGRPWLEVDVPAPTRPLPDAIHEALRRQARDMLLDADGTAGVSALERFAAELPGWPGRTASEADRSFTFRYAYQVVEKRGTGGGHFRLLYARFLREAEAAVVGLAGLGLAARMEDLAARWSRLAGFFREIAGVPGGGVPPAAVEGAQELARAERRFFEDVAARVP
jgi:hypothetical protein